MANSNSLFITYNGALQIGTSKRKKLMTSKDALMKRISEYFKRNHPDYIPNFYIQGSYKIGSMIRTKDDTCDLDLGVIFKRIPDVSPTTLQGWVKSAVTDHTSVSPEHRSKCIRVIFSGEYHIDLPVFYQGDREKHLHLAVKNEDWQDDDPKEFRNWYLDIKDSEGQLLRTVRYLKGWSDFRSKKLPSGLEMTVMAAKYMKYHKRDDIALRDTLQQMQKSLRVSFRCDMKTTPHENLFAKYSENRKMNFLDALDSFISDANAAIEERNFLNASKKWQKHLGSYFPDGKDEVDDDVVKGIRLSESSGALGTGKVIIDKQGKVSSRGTISKEHRNYGPSE